MLWAVVSFVAFVTAWSSGGTTRSLETLCQADWGFAVVPKSSSGSKAP